jgi:lipopolysaccharide/colanic/teichoic acid biosynthesis glycosyltransferase
VERVRDVILAGIGLLMVLPLLLVLALLVWMLEGRPILFTQMRSGLRRVPFRVFKFRTMRVLSDEQGHLLPDGQRITPLGRWLRVSRLDELPQLWSVLVGDMSLVGPRPLLATTIAEGGEGAQRRGMVRPGLTGWAQINGNALLSDPDKIALDEWYVANRSQRLDLMIMARTVLVVLFGERVDMFAIRRAHARSPHRGG